MKSLFIKMHVIFQSALLIPVIRALKAIGISMFEFNMHFAAQCLPGYRYALFFFFSILFILLAYG